MAIALQEYMKDTSQKEKKYYNDVNPEQEVKIIFSFSLIAANVHFVDNAGILGILLQFYQNLQLHRHNDSRCLQIFHSNNKELLCYHHMLGSLRQKHDP